MDLYDFLDRLEAAQIYYRLNRVNENIMVEIAVPGQRLEVEFLRDGSVQVERFLSEGTIGDEKVLAAFWDEFGDV